RPRLAEIVAHSARLAALKQRFQRQQAIQHATIESLIGLGGLAVLSAGAALVSGGRIPRVELPLVTLLAVSAFAPVIGIVTVGKELMQTVGAARRYFAIEDEPVAVRDGPDATPPAPPAGARGLPIRFEDVTFRYPGGARPALRGVSFAVAAGQTVALVGRSGAGKTTAAHLLLRFWDPQSGRILVGAHDLRAFALDTLRGQVALVAQDTYLFHASL